MPLSPINPIKLLEASTSCAMFLKDTGGCLVPKLALSRSKDETREIIFQETSESAIFYFSAPILAKTMSKFFSNAKGIKAQKLAKFSKIASVFGIILPMIYSIAPIRNYLTYKKTNKDKFSSVIALNNYKHSENPNEENKENKENKIKNLIKKLGLISLTTLSSTFLLNLLSKNKTFYKAIEPVLDKTIKHFDFTKTNDLTTKHYAALIYPVSILSYLNSSRDKYEKNENIRRFSITVPLMLFGDKIIEKPIYKTCDKLFNTNLIKNNKIMTYDEISKLTKNKSMSLKSKTLKSKNIAMLSTFLINTVLIAGAVSLLNRIKTKQDYQKDDKKITLDLKHCLGSNIKI